MAADVEGRDGAGVTVTPCRPDRDVAAARLRGKPAHIGQSGNGGRRALRKDATVETARPRACQFGAPDHYVAAKGSLAVCGVPGEQAPASELSPVNVYGLTQRGAGAVESLRRE